jgi:hypothetical protein
MRIAEDARPRCVGHSAVALVQRKEDVRGDSEAANGGQAEHRESCRGCNAQADAQAPSQEDAHGAGKKSGNSAEDTGAPSQALEVILPPSTY